MAYTVTIFKNANGQFGFQHPSGAVHYKAKRSYNEALNFCRDNNWSAVPADGLKVPARYANSHEWRGGEWSRA